MTEGEDQCTVGIELHGYGNRDLLAKLGLRELCGNGSVLAVEVNVGRDAAGAAWTIDPSAVVRSSQNECLGVAS